MAVLVDLESGIQAETAFAMITGRVEWVTWEVWVRSR
jgi:hypothetical protein